MKGKTIPPITPKTFREIITPWLTAIHKKDVLAIMSYPSSDRQRRLLNLLSQPQTIASLLPNASKYLFISIDYRVDPINTPEQLESFLMTRIQKALGFTMLKQPKDFEEFLKTIQKQKNKTIVLAAIGCEKLTKDKRSDMFIWSVLQQRTGIMRQLLFFETNLLDVEHIQFFGNIPTFLPRITGLHLYEKEDVMQFMKLKEHDWKFQVNETTKNNIFAMCGGSLLLTKRALLLLRDNPSLPLDAIWKHLETQFDLAAVWHGFGQREQLTLKTISQGLPVTDSDLSQSLHYLLITGFIRQKGNRFETTIPLFAKYISDTYSKTYRFSLDGNSILLNGTIINANFSRNEQASLICLIRAHGLTVTRTTLADFIWPDNKGDFSDWALDSIISRVRKKLSTLGVPPDVIIVQKKQGICLKNNT